MFYITDILINKKDTTMEAYIVYTVKKPNGERIVTSYKGVWGKSLTRPGNAIRNALLTYSVNQIMVSVRGVSYGTFYKTQKQAIAHLIQKLN